MSGQNTVVQLRYPVGIQTFEKIRYSIRGKQ
jgi:hypothetical protein